jgi:flagellar motor switch protein FliN/FliY
MAEHDVGSLLAATVETMFQRAGAELAEALGCPVTAKVERGKRLFASDLERLCGARGLAVAGSLSGQAEGTVAFVLRRDQALLLAREAEQAGAQAPEGAGAALSEADVAAVAFALARLGAAASALWKDELGHEVAWPAEPAELTAQPFDPAAEGGGLDQVVGAEELAAWTVRLGEPIGVVLYLALATGTAEALASLLDPEAGWAPPSADQRGGSVAEGLARLLPVELPVRVVVARRRIALRELLQLVPGRVLDLDRRCGEPLELYAGGKLVARGDAMMVDECMGFRVAQLVPDGATVRPAKLVR